MPGGSELGPGAVGTVTGATPWRVSATSAAQGVSLAPMASSGGLIRSVRKSTPADCSTRNAPNSAVASCEVRSCSEL